MELDHPLCRYRHNGRWPYPVLHRMEYGTASSKAFLDAACIDL